MSQLAQIVPEGRLRFAPGHPTANLTDSSGNVLQTYAYGIFGDLRYKYGSAATDRLFTGEQRDAESGFDYLRARYYDPAIGRFLSNDPLGGSYPYASNNPVNRSDPLGLYSICGFDDPALGAGMVCYDSTEVGLPAALPDYCEVSTNTCIWYADGFTADYNYDADTENAIQKFYAGQAIAANVGSSNAPSGGGDCDGPCYRAPPDHGFILNTALQAAEWGFYAGYYATHQLNQLNTKVTGVPSLSLTLISAGFLASDSAVDVIRGTPVNDAGYLGSICADFAQPFIACPRVWLPGINRDWSIDLP